MVYDRVMAAINDGHDVAKMFYVDGPGGTGKTTLYLRYIYYVISTLSSQGRSVLAVTFTGIAASLINGGTTVHLAFGNPNCHSEHLQMT